jgi:hypothetical protein
MLLTTTTVVRPGALAVEDRAGHLSYAEVAEAVEGDGGRIGSGLGEAIALPSGCRSEVKKSLHFMERCAQVASRCR